MSLKGGLHRKHRHEPFIGDAICNVVEGKSTSNKYKELFVNIANFTFNQLFNIVSVPY